MPARKKFVSRPDHVKVGHRNYSINWLTEEQWKSAGFDDGLRGETYNHTGIINIRLFDDETGTAADSMFRECLLHEIMHAVASSSLGWNCWDALDRNRRDDYDTVEELMVGFWAPVLLQVMKDNPDVMAYLLDDQEHE